jgi:hypothetical protein
MSDYAIPANSSINFLDSLTISNASTLTIPNSGTVFIENTNNPRIPYWDTILRVGPPDFTTTSTILVDITGFSFAVSASSLYEVECVWATFSSDANGAKVGWHFTSTGAEFIAVIDEATSTANAQIFMPAVDTGSTTFNTAAVDFLLIIKGYIKTGSNSGTISLRCTKQATGTFTIYSGSVMKVRNRTLV